MLLSVIERVLLVNIMPREGSVINLKLLREFRESLSFSEEENKALSLSVDDHGSVHWRLLDDDGNAIPQVKEIPVNQIMFDIAKKTLAKMNKDEILKEEHLPLYEKFCEAGD
ncbi:hypothetical protein CMI37_30775 [Candidatus Pacearchaeota archaeon]|nr:hypothetical protein [Candidatus Pacearchaeota archaeon]|tara:strand:+ start:26 stop:361 length:336 start_codon:yes stop_codon:yes gene_type:complete